MCVCVCVGGGVSGGVHRCGSEQQGGRSEQKHTVQVQGEKNFANLAHTRASFQPWRAFSIC